MTAEDAFKDEFTHSHGGQCYFVAVDPAFPLQVTDLARVVAQVAVQGDDAERSAYVDAAVQRATDAQPPAVEPTLNDDQDQDSDSTPIRPKDTPESLEAKRAILRDLVSQLAQSGQGAIRNLADRQVLGFTNLLLSLVLELLDPNSERDDAVRSLVKAIAPAPESTLANPALSTRYSALATIFNALPFTTAASSKLRFHVLTTLIESAAEHDDIAIVRPALAENQLELYFNQSQVVDESAELADETTSRIVEALLKNAAGPKAADPVGTARLAREILLARLSSVTQSDGGASETRTKLGATLLALSFASNEVYDFTPFSRGANRFPSLHSGSSNSNALTRTLDLFTTATDAELDVAQLPSQADLDAAIAESTLLPPPSASSTSSSSPAASSSSSTTGSAAATTAASAPTRLDRAQVERKIKLVKLAQLCENKVGGQVRYEEIKRKLGLNGQQQAAAQEDDGDDEGEEVETWVIDAIRASLLQGRLSQPTRSLFVTRAAPVAPGAFSNDKWNTVQQRLEEWKDAIERVTQTVEKSLNVAASGSAAAGRRAGAEEVVANHHHHQQQQQAIEA